MVKSEKLVQKERLVHRVILVLKERVDRMEQLVIQVRRVTLVKMVTQEHKAQLGLLALKGRRV